MSVCVVEYQTTNVIKNNGQQFILTLTAALYTLHTRIYPSSIPTYTHKCTVSVKTNCTLKKYTFINYRYFHYQIVSFLIYKIEKKIQKMYAKIL